MKKDQYSKKNGGERLTKTQHMIASYQAGIKKIIKFFFKIYIILTYYF